MRRPTRFLKNNGQVSLSKIRRDQGVDTSLMQKDNKQKHKQTKTKSSETLHRTFFVE